MEFFGKWRELNRRIEGLNPSAQLMMYKLFWEFDKRRFPPNVSISNREMLGITGLGSLATIAKAQAQLIESGLIEVQATRRATQYRLILGDSVSQGVTQGVSSSETQGVTVCPQANQRVREPLNRCTAKTSLERERDAGARIFSEWRSEKMPPLSERQERELLELETRYGETAVVEAIRRTKDACNAPSYAYFANALKGGEKRGTTKRTRPLAREAVELGY